VDDTDVVLYMPTEQAEHADAIAMEA